MFTNQTPNYGLPQYTSPDELNVLVDFNGAMSAIDTQMKSNELAAQDAKNTAVSASNKADANTLSIQALNDDVNDPATGVGPRVTALEGRVNTIDSLIGNGVPTVGDDTLIGGINANAASIETINTNTGNLADLDTTDKSSLVAAINEVAQGGGGGDTPAVEVQRGTLAIGSTSVVLTFAAQTIGVNTLVDIYTDVYGVNPVAVATTSNTVALTFDAQESAVSVAVRIQN